MTEVSRVRLFIALDPDVAARTDLSRALAAAAGTVTDPSIRLVDVDRWHLTLVFLGSVAPERVELLTSHLADAAAASRPVEWHVEGSGRFPDRGAARVVWMGVGGDVEGLRRLVRRVRHAARESRIEVERRAYRPHLTVARCRPGDVARDTEGPRSGEAVSKDPASQILTRLAHYRGPTTRSTEVVLYRSHLGPHPTYESLAVWPLGARPQVQPPAPAPDPRSVEDDGQSRSTT